MKCDWCGTEYGKGEGFHGVKYKSGHFCSQDCYESYVKMKSTPKPPVNFKPEVGTERRKFTDYIQDWIGDANWAWLMKQAKDIQDEYELNWKDMYLTLKYCKEYEEVEWNKQYGLYQFFPRYIQPMRDFISEAKAFKEISEDDITDEFYYVKKKKISKEKEVEF